MEHYKHHIGLGVAGNFALHLEQAGESGDFVDVVSEDPHGPKGIFPFYIPSHEGALGVYPLDSKTLCLPHHTHRVQMEPEVVLECTLSYDEAHRVCAITPVAFGAYNDCSLRIKASKISHKKNWGPKSKGIAPTLIPIDRFEEGGIMDRYAIASFWRARADLPYQLYGEDVKLSGYSYFYQKLLSWLTQQLRTQHDHGPLEAIHHYLEQAHYPTQALISIGATRYTPLGEDTFLREGDEIAIVVYDTHKHDAHEALELGFGSVLIQKVVRD